MLHYAAFHQGLHCLQKYLISVFFGFESRKDLEIQNVNFQYASKK